ncbi:uncharacterized protein LY79DRAFT_290592 [Colletotrichum navitas]|uniref:Uncharacterized protein n=1 Tax=Colletotrichum navitas TaxID=681940 RepID=A0AAD8PVR7_9PEZI|nr:uncharacterized protein LY79DRAFT_290592 [Colletotrichum navitas]KAK1584849.1 hypothetical protein LY79DRAFT_290592 [Colletotrichum navitas]
MLQSPRRLGCISTRYSLKSRRTGSRQAMRTGPLSGERGPLMFGKAVIGEIGRCCKLEVANRIPTRVHRIVPHWLLTSTLGGHLDRNMASPTFCPSLPRDSLEVESVTTLPGFSPNRESPRTDPYREVQIPQEREPQSPVDPTKGLQTHTGTRETCQISLRMADICLLRGG